MKLSFSRAPFATLLCISAPVTTQAFLTPSIRRAIVAGSDNTQLFYKHNGDIDQDEAADLLKTSPTLADAELAPSNRFDDHDTDILLNYLLTTVYADYTPSPYRPIPTLLQDLADGIFDKIRANNNCIVPSVTIDKHALEQHFKKVTTDDDDQAANEYADIVMSVLLDYLDDHDGLIHRADMRHAFSKYDFKLLYETLTGTPIIAASAKP